VTEKIIVKCNKNIKQNIKMKKVIRLTESELTNIIKKVATESQKSENVNEQLENFMNPEAMETGDAILTIIGTVIGLLGIAGYDVLRDMAKKLMRQGKEEEAKQILDYVRQNKSEGSDENMMESVRRRTKRVSKF
jgi:transcription initiation factor IIE alpha subunit